MDFSDLGLGLLLQFSVIGLYLAGTLATLAGVFTRRPALTKLGLGCAVAGFVAHTLDLGVLTSQPGSSLIEGGFHLSLFAWLLLLVWFIAWFKLRLGFLALTVSPLALVVYVASLAAARLTVAMPKQLVGLFFALHVGTLFLALASLAVAFGAGLAFLHLQRRIKGKQKLSGFRQDLPSLSSFDKANHLAVAVGFPLYTLGLAAGFIWARATWGKIFTWDPKELAAIIVWLLFAYLFHQRMVMGWQGRKPAVLAMWIFGMAVISMFGINFFLPTHHRFMSVPS